MKLVGKLTFAIVLVMCAVLGVYGYLRVQQERAIFEEDMRRDEHMLGRAMSAAVEEAWRHDGPERALQIIAAANDREDGIRLRWVWLDAPVGDAHRPEADPATLGPVVAGSEVVRVDPFGSSEGRLYTYVPVQLDGGRVGALELSESLDERERYVRASIRATVIAGVLLAAVSGAVALALGVFFVGRPVRALADKARRIGLGDLGGQLTLRRRDELTLLAEEMNLMCERLAEARTNLAREASARLQTVEQLRHADRLTTVGKLASGIAHELGTPLNVVAGRAKMVVRAAPSPDAVENAQIIVEQADRMTRIIRQLLDFARHRSAQKAPTDLAQLTKQTLALLQPLAKKRDVTLRRGGEGSVPAEVDVGQIQQALTNLVVNAMQSMSLGGEVTVTLARGLATPPPDHGGAQAEFLDIEVADQGAGITPENLSRIFEPFFTTKEVGEGTGLGLSVAYGIVREHGGWIDVQSTPGRGSRFTMRLPASRA
jgi:signal transduction histidine kinase